MICVSKPSKSKLSLSVDADVARFIRRSARGQPQIPGQGRRPNATLSLYVEHVFRNIEAGRPPEDREKPEPVTGSPARDAELFEALREIRKKKKRVLSDLVKLATAASERDDVARLLRDLLACLGIPPRAKEAPGQRDGAPGSG